MSVIFRRGSNAGGSVSQQDVRRLPADLLPTARLGVRSGYSLPRLGIRSGCLPRSGAQSGCLPRPGRAFGLSAASGHPVGLSAAAGRPVVLVRKKAVGKEYRRDGERAAYDKLQPSARARGVAAGDRLNSCGKERAAEPVGGQTGGRPRPMGGRGCGESGGRRRCCR